MIVSVLIVTYDRPREIRETIEALKKHVKYPRDELRWVVCDDGTSGNYVYHIQQDFPELNIRATITPRKGFGANVNKGLKHCWNTSDFVLFNEDDRPPIKTYDLEKAVALLSSTKDAHKPEGASARGQIGCVRLSGIASHWMTLQSREADTSIGKLNYLHLLKSSPFLNIWSNQPSIIHRRFFDCYGLFPEGISLGETETVFAKTFKHKKGGPWICILTDGIDTAQRHIGHSRQGSEHDIGSK